MVSGVLVLREGLPGAPAALPATWMCVRSTEAEVSLQGPGPGRPGHGLLPSAAAAHQGDLGEAGEGLHAEPGGAVLGALPQQEAGEAAQGAAAVSKELGDGFKWLG